MPVNTIGNEFTFLCTLLSPFTSPEEFDGLRKVAALGLVDWQALARSVNRSELAPALQLALDRRGISAEVPETFRAYLEEIHRFNVSRNEALLGQLLEVVQLLNAINVTPLLLKGGAALATDLFPAPGMRFMWDLDLLVPEERLEQSVAALLAAGYDYCVEETGVALSRMVSAANHHHAALIRPGAQAKVELHHRLLGKEFDLLQPDEVWSDSRPYTGCRLPGVAAALMSPTAELLYCFAHSELAHSHHRYARVDARHLHHFAYLCYRFQGQIEWSRLEALKQHPHYGHIFTAYLYMAKSLFRVNLPLTCDPDPYAEHHYRMVMSVRSGWKRQFSSLRLMFRELIWAFSQERLRNLYPQEDIPITYLRLRHFSFLMGRYKRFEAWRARLHGLRPF